MAEAIVVGSPYSPLVGASSYPLLALLLLAIGLVASANFMSYELQVTKFNRKLARELQLAVPAAAFLAMGTLYLFLSVGLYV